MPAYLPEEVLLPSAHSSEPCVAGLYFRLYAAEPGFALEKDMVEGFLVCSVEVRGGDVQQEAFGREGGWGLPF